MLLTISPDSAKICCRVTARRDLSTQSRRSGRRLCRSPVWSHIEPGGAAALEAAAKRLAAAGAIVSELVLPDPFNGLMDAHAAIMHREGGVSFLPEYVNAYALLAPSLRDKVDNANGVSSQALLESYALADTCRPAFDALYAGSLDVVLTPSAPGEAPEGLHTTGSFIFNSIWTLLHVPCVTSPPAAGRAGCRWGCSWWGRDWRMPRC